MLFNDVSEIHNLSVKLEDPELFDRVLDTAIEKALEKFSPQDSPQDRGFGEKFVLPVTYLRDLADAVEDTPSYIAYPDLKEGELSLLVGPAKLAGKTRFTLEQIKAMRTGALFLRGHEQKKRIVFNRAGQ